MARYEPDREALAARLQERGFLSSQALGRALVTVPRSTLVPDVCRPLAALDVPVPMVDPTLEAVPCPSPRVAVTLLEALDVSPGDRVLVEGEAIGWIAALAAHLARDGSVLARETHRPSHQALTEKAGALELDALEVADETPRHAGGPPPLPDGGGPFDRVLVTDPRRAEAAPADHLADDGQLVAIVPAGDGDDPTGPVELDLLRVLQVDGERTELRLGGIHVADQAEGLLLEDVDGPEQVPGDARMTVQQLLQTETLLADAWTRSHTAPTALDLREAVDETIGEALEIHGVRASEPARARVAWGAFHLGYVHQMTGEFHTAVDAYGASAAVYATAEAYTFRGWVTSHLGDLHAAIEDCKRAIDTDPTLGNPYNDIGAYLLELDRPREAIGWLEDALDAERYRSPHFPHLNLGRAHLDVGDREAARRELQRALEIEPDCEPARWLLRRIEGGDRGR